MQHALNGGEINVVGYYLDAYDKDNNIVVEYDEKHHFNKDGTLKNKDIKRMNEIMNNLNCKFFRFNDITKKINEYKND